MSVLLQEKEKLQELLSMDEKEFFAESIMFMLGKTMALAEGKISSQEYQQCKSLVDGISQFRETMLKPLPKFPEKGWLFPYLVEGDRVFGINRWNWWMQCLLEEEIKGSIPQIQFHTHEFDTGVKDTISHIEKVLRGIEMNVGLSSSLTVLVEWLLWGLGSSSIEEKTWNQTVDQFLYKEFQLGRLQKYPFDYWAKFAQEARGSNRFANPTSFYQTPPNVCLAMVNMAFTNSENTTTQSVCDPCCGTGTMLLFASNHSVNLYGQEICLDLCLMSELNGYLYMPWLVRPAPFLKSTSIGQQDNPPKSSGKQEGEKTRKKIVIENKEITFGQDDKGQLLLFD